MFLVAPRESHADARGRNHSPSLALPFQKLAARRGAPFWLESINTGRPLRGEKSGAQERNGNSGPQ